MEKFLISLVAKRVKLNGQDGYERPESGYRQKLFDLLSDSLFRKEHRKIQGFQIDKLKEVLNDLTAHFQSQNHAFVANMYSNQSDGVQIVHPFMNRDKIPNRTEEFAFSIYFTFDSNSKGIRKQHEQFVNANIEDLEPFILDETVYCYDLNCGMNTNKVFIILRKYYEEVLGYDQNTLYYFDASSHGEINKMYSTKD